MSVVQIEGAICIAGKQLLGFPVSHFCPNSSYGEDHIFVTGGE
jgi:hypothetical protein